MKVYWGDYTHVRSILALMKMALSGGQYDYLHLLSGADLPLKSQDYIHGFCRENRGMEFVAYNRMGADQVEWVKYAYPFNRYLRSPSGLLRSAYKRLRHRTLNAQRSMGIDRRTRFEGQIKYGSDWFSITSDLAKRLLAREATVKYVFKQAFIPSEFFVQTILWDSDLRDRIFDLGNPYRSNMRYIDFSRRSGSSPYVFREGDFEALVASDRLFARKFDSRIDRLIVDKMFDHLVAQY